MSILIGGAQTSPMYFAVLQHNSPLLVLILMMLSSMARLYEMP